MSGARAARDASADSGGFAARDLVELVHAAVRHGGHLLTAGERALLLRTLELPEDAAALFARLESRKTWAWPTDRLVGGGALADWPEQRRVAATEVLCEAGLLTRTVAWSVRCAHAQRAALVDGCKRLGLPATGRVSALRERLSGLRDWEHRSWVALRHRALFARCARWATLKMWPDRGLWVAERLGHVRWPDYTPTPAASGSARAMVATREAWWRWERVVLGPGRAGPSGGAMTPPEDAVSGVPLEEALHAYARTDWPEGGLNPRPGLHRAIMEAARELERAGEPAAALDVYGRLLEGGSSKPGAVLLRRAMCLEALDRPADAVAEIVELRDTVSEAQQGPLQRTGRRLARKAGCGWPPLRPRREATARALRLELAQAGDRHGSKPLWRGVQGAAAVRIEAAVAATVRQAGRDVLRGEGAPWQTLVALLLLPASFAPVPGMLPVPRLRGPIDRGTPAFAARRPTEIWAVLDAVQAGEAPRMVAEAEAAWRGVSLSGAAWPAVSRKSLLAMAALDPAVLRVVLHAALREGRGAFAGLPDLLVLPGPPARLAGAVPRRIRAAATFVEVKGPGDSLRGAQRVWIDRLLGAGAAVEVWSVLPREAG